MNRRPLRIVVTGGPGGGKSTVARIFFETLSKVVLVPEAASLVFSMGFPRNDRPKIRRACQRAIFHLQKNLEEAEINLAAGRIILCDRGTLDGIAYWPGSSRNFLKEVRSTLQKEFSRYDAVMFLETAAVGGISIRGGNPHRHESIEEACRLDKKLRRIWGGHRRFIHVPHYSSFDKKLSRALEVLLEIAGERRRR